MTEDFLYPEILISAYSQGFFPMADETGKIYWHNPDPRAIIPLRNVKVPRSLKQFFKKNDVTFRIDSNFEYVIKKCAQRRSSWISPEIEAGFIMFHDYGFAHSVETYIDGEIVGGLYGVAIGGAFFGESMFSDVSNASKAAFYYLVFRMIDRGFILLDSQYVNEFTRSLGAIEIPKINYLNILKRALTLPCSLI
ncbi:leucyl/phenylalanyl-tRNA--protein transferase [Bacteroidetes/Chlorobi group bacterium ChocPot_Mid]|nr:MAG: leucyl/phenylalanyl-tRNA--protein transferase [Bacteroidetes/Chlorobi group bacterium ChocPot_Mid]